MRIKISARGSLMIPDAAVKAANLEKGEVVEIEFEKGRLEARQPAVMQTIPPPPATSGQASGPPHPNGRLVREPHDEEQTVMYRKAMNPAEVLALNRDTAPSAPKRELASSPPMSEWTSPEDEEAWSDL